MSDEESSWIEALPEPLREGPFTKDTESLESYATKLTEAAQYMGNSLRIPGPDAGESDWKAFDEKLQSKVPDLMRINLDSEEARAELMTRLGRPEDPAGYGAEGDGAWLADVAHKAGLTKAQFESLVQGVGDTTTQRSAEDQAKLQEQLEALDQEWGLSKSKKLDHIKGLAKLTEAPESLLQQIEDGTADAATLRWMDRIAGQFAEAAKFTEDRNTPSTASPLEAKAQIQELLNNPDLFASNDIGRSLQKKMIELQQAANPPGKYDEPEKVDLKSLFGQ